MSSDNRSEALGYIFGFGSIMAVAFFAGMAAITRMIGAASIPIWLFGFGAIGWALHGPIGKALASRIGAQDAPEHAELPPEVYTELDEMRMRIAELEERTEFSERLLLQKGSQQPAANSQ